MTLLELASAAARAGIVTACARNPLRPLSLENGHRFVGIAATAHKLGHQLHRMINMLEESFVAGAQIIETRLAIGSLDKPVLWTFAVAGKTHVALAAITRQRVALVIPEFDLLF